MVMRSVNKKIKARFIEYKSVRKIHMDFKDELHSAV